LIGMIAAPLIEGFPFPTSPTTLLSGLMRALFAFHVGVTIREAYASGKLKAPAWPFVPPLVVAVLCLALPETPLIFLFVATVAAPLIVAGATCEAGSARLGALYRRLGGLSYPLYAIHAPLFALFKIGYDAAAGQPYREAPPAIVSLGFAVAVVLFAAWLAEAVEPPARAWLSRRWPLSAPREASARLDLAAEGGAQRS